MLRTQRFGEPDQQSQDGRASDESPEDNQRLRPGDAARLEKETREHGSDIASSADNARDSAEGSLVDERDDGVGDAVGHLDEQAGDEHAGDSEREPIRQTEGDQRNTFEREGDAEQRRAAVESPTCVTAVADDAAQRAGEEVHHAEGAGDDTGCSHAEVEVVDKVERGDVVDGEFHAEAGGIDDTERPDAAVAAGFTKCGARSIPRGAGRSPSSRGCVLSEEPVHDARDQHRETGHHHREPPACEGGTRASA